MDGPGRPFGETLHEIFVWIQTLGVWVTSRVGVVTVTAAYTVPANIFFVRADVTAGGFSVTLPLAVGKDGRQISVMKIDASGNTLTVIPTGSDTINASASVTTTTRFAKWIFISNGNNAWEVIS